MILSTIKLRLMFKLFLANFAATIMMATLANAQVIEGLPIEEVSPGQSVVYFVRYNSTGSLINFTVLDSAMIIGKFSGRGYIRYECEPGSHLFWARSENRDFLYAELEEGRTYVVELRPIMGAIKAGVILVPVDYNRKGHFKKIHKLMTRAAPIDMRAADLAALNIKYKDMIDRGLQTYQSENMNGVPINVLFRSNYYSPGQVPIAK